MTDKPTLREKAKSILFNEAGSDELCSERILNRISSILEDTGSPAYMRVAKELRGE